MYGVIPSRSGRSLLVFCIAVAATVVAVLLTRVDGVGWRLGDVILSTYAILLCLLLPPRFAVAVLTGCVALYSGLHHVSVTKIAVTQMPLTMLDLRIAVANPAGFVTAIGLPSWTTDAIRLIGVGVVCFLAWELRRLLLFVRRRPKDGVSSLLAALGIVLLAVFAASIQTQVIADELKQPRFSKLWNPEHLASLSRNVGVLTFLVYSRVLERHDEAIFFANSAAAPLSGPEIEAAADRYLYRQAAPAVRPNIVLVHLESTFDPNAAFILTSAIPNPLFESNPLTRWRGHSRVNVVGGGSWVTEFEALTGLDSRLFGYSGHYTHSSLAAYVTGAFPSYLRSRGYRTLAYYSWPGVFYNARFAFTRYGFDTFLDADDLRVPHLLDVVGFTRAEQIDQKIADATIRQMHKEASDRPLFAFVEFAENHGPHRCLHFSSPEQFYTTFRNSDDFQLNCALNEYILRLNSTARAFETLKTFLQERQLATGRPFVILGYGDHQPSTFTQISSEGQGNAALRTTMSIRETTFVLESSVAGILRCCVDVPVPSTLIPSILSAYVARDATDLYLPVNFYLFAACGSDAWAQIGPVGSDRIRDQRLAQSTPCAAAGTRALPMLQRAGILQH